MVYQVVFIQQAIKASRVGHPSELYAPRSIRAGLHERAQLGLR